MKNFVLVHVFEYIRFEQSCFYVRAKQEKMLQESIGTNEVLYGKTLSNSSSKTNKTNEHENQIVDEISERKLHGAKRNFVYKTPLNFSTSSNISNMKGSNGSTGSGSIVQDCTERTSHQLHNNQDKLNMISYFLLYVQQIFLVHFYENNHLHQV